MPTLNKPPIESNNAMTTVFIEELCEINLNGLRILSNLNILIIGIFTFVRHASINEQTTIKKSSYDQFSLK